MFSKNLKKKVAVLLTGTMILGMTVTAFAADPVTNGSSTGDSTFEGTVDREVSEVVLPTVPAKTYDFIMDAERLVQETDKMRYAGYNFPAKSADGGVYFLSGEKTYTNDSAVYTVSNNGAVDINLTVEVEAETNTDKDVALVSTNIAKADCSDRNNAVDEAVKLFLGLKLGDENVVAVTKDAKASSTVTLAGKPENYQVSWNSVKSKYEFVMKNGATGFETADFYIQGATNYVKTAGEVTAPNIEVTWKWQTKKAADAAAAGEAVTKAKNDFLTANPVAVKAVGDIVAGDLEAITTAQTRFAALTDEVKTALAANSPAVTAESLAALKTACDALQITDETGSLQYIGSLTSWYVGKTNSAGISNSTFTPVSVQMKKDSGELVTVPATVEEFSGTYWVKVAYDDGAAKGITYTAGSTYTAVVVVGTTRYTATVTY